MPRLSKIGAAALAAFGWTTGGAAVTASYLVVAGGGSGGYGGAGASGGGGAGGLLTGSLSLNPALSYTVTVGAGGARIIGSSIGVNGSNSVFSTITSTGGGGGGEGNGTTANGANGGSGGGAGEASTTRTGGTGISGQGNNGGNGASTQAAGGGGGAGAAGATGTYSPAVSGAGGAGLASSISGTSTYYAGGGGGGVYLSGTLGAGGIGGGGAGANGAGSAAGAGTANLGGGGGGGSNYGSPAQPSGQGGSGVVIISYAGAQQFSGGIVTSVGGNTIHTFTTSGTLGPITTLSASYLMVGGGGGGGWNIGGGGGAGGLLSGSGVTIDPNSTYLVTVGAGGAGGVNGTSSANGSNSTFSMVTTAAVGGGLGGNNSLSPNSGASGGSGGGGAGQTSGTGGTGTTSQGNAGGNALSGQSGGGGGGGGAGAVGQAGVLGQGGAGGVGVASSISGTSTFYAGGGGAGGISNNGSQASLAGAGGNGGGGAGGYGANSGIGNGTAGTANTGGGGGGSANYGGVPTTIGGQGGSGVVIISYAGATQQMAGGTVTIVGGNVIHTFTATGFLAPIDFSTGSLRFRQSNSAYLTRTPTVAGNRRKWTWSAWIKRGLSGDQKIFSGGTGTGATNYLQIYFNSSDGITVSNYVADLFSTTAVYRDYAAWYHIVWVVDTDSATTTNRMQLYVNGTLVTTANVTGDLGVNQTQQHSISANNYGAYGDQEMTEINFVDGQALAPTSFGTFNSYGVWQSINYGGSYGTNGFYLPFNRQAVSYVGSFSGSTQYLTTTLPATLSGQFTIEIYVYRNTSATSVMFTFGDSILSTGLEMYIGSSGTLFQIYSNNAAQISSGTLVPKVGGWSHVALTRDSSNVVRLFLNGVQLGGTWTTTAAFSSTLRIGAEFYNGAFNPGYWDGYMSNFRVVTGTALYTGNFIPSTSALTAVSGTQLLTLQNSSIVDNSTNALSITNTNGVSTGQTYPFAYGIFNDQGPAGNNWTPSGISGAFGSTLDYMGDAPTLTSSTVSNYATWNPIGNGGGTLSNANLTSTTSSTTATVAGMAMQTGKWYWEVTIQTSSNPRIGVYDIGSAAPTDFGATAYGWCILNSPSRTFNNNSAPSYGSFAPVNGTVAIVAYDADNGRLWYGQDGTWFASGNPATNANPSQTSVTGRAIVAAVSSGSGSNVFNINFGQQPFVYTPPSGFIALNAFNL